MRRLFAAILSIMMVLSSSMAIGEDTVTLTLPSWFNYEESSLENFETGSAIRNDDGSIALTMTKDDLQKEIESIVSEFQKGIDEMVNDESGLLSVASIESNDDLSQIDVYLDANEVGFEAFYCMTFPLYAWSYQIMSGCPYADFASTITFYNANKEVIESTSFTDVEMQSYIEALVESAQSEESITTEEEFENTAYDAELNENAFMQAGESLIIDDVCELAHVQTKIEQEIKPEKTDGVYSYYDAEPGKKYVDVILTYKNLAAKGVTEDEIIDGLLIYSDKYEYDGFAVVETDGRSDFNMYYKIDPLCTEYIHYLFEVPDEVANSSESLVAVLNIHDSEYKVIVR